MKKSTTPLSEELTDEMLEEVLTPEEPPEELSTEPTEHPEPPTTPEEPPETKPYSKKKKYKIGDRFIKGGQTMEVIGFNHYQNDVYYNVEIIEDKV